MDCQQCLEENKRCITEKGYGYGYIGKHLNCERHKKTVGENMKWTDGRPHERSRKMKHQIRTMEKTHLSLKNEEPSPLKHPPKFGNA